MAAVSKQGAVGMLSVSYVRTCRPMSNCDAAKIREPLKPLLLRAITMAAYDLRLVKILQQDKRLRNGRRAGKPPFPFWETPVYAMGNERFHLRNLVRELGGASWLGQRVM